MHTLSIMHPSPAKRRRGAGTTLRFLEMGIGEGRKGVAVCDPFVN